MKVFGSKPREDLKLKRYDNGTFFFDQAGKEITLDRVSIIEMGMDFRHLAPVAAVREEPDVVDIKGTLAAGKVTIVDFHLPEEMARIRQGSYAKSLASRSKGRVAYVQIPLAGWEDPDVTAHDLTSLPQFWIYNRSGSISSRLVDRFMDTDIDDAVKAAR